MAASPPAPLPAGKEPPPPHSHRHTLRVPAEQVGPLSPRPPPFLPPRPRSLLFFFLFFPPSAASCLPSLPPPARTRCAEPGSCGCCCRNSCGGVSAFLYLGGETEGGGAAAIRSRSPYKSVCVCVGGGGGLLPTPRSPAAHTGTLSRTMEEEPPSLSPSFSPRSLSPR